MKVRFAALLATVLVLATARMAHAAPMVSSLDTVRAEATTIVVGTMVPNTLDIDVDTVVRGSASLGRRRLSTPPDAFASASGRIVAFVDGKGALRWIGSLVAGPSIEKGVLLLSGFFDFNAHLVMPGVMTFAELTGYLATGKLTQRLAVTLVVPDGHGGVTRTATRFVIPYEALLPPGKPRMSTPVRVGACIDHAAVMSLEWGAPSVFLSGTCGNHARSLSLAGRITGVDATGAIEIDGAAESPYLEAADLATFLADATIRDAKRFLDVSLDDGTVWRWEASKGLVDPAGAKHAAGSMSLGSSMSNGVTVDTQTYAFDGGVVVEFHPTRVAGGSSGGSARTLISLIDAKAVGPCTFKQAGKPDRTCTLGRGRTVFVR